MSNELSFSIPTEYAEKLFPLLKPKELQVLLAYHYFEGYVSGGFATNKTLPGLVGMDYEKFREIAERLCVFGVLRIPADNTDIKVTWKEVERDLSKISLASLETRNRLERSNRAKTDQ